MTKLFPAPELVRSMLRIVAARNTPAAELPQLVATLYQALEGVAARPESNQPVSSSLLFPSSPAPRKLPRSTAAEREPVKSVAARRVSAEPVSAPLPPAPTGEEAESRTGNAPAERPKQVTRRKRAELGRETAWSTATEQETEREAAPEAPMPVAAPAPGLMRRADIVGEGEAGLFGRIAQSPRSSVRGIVKWFDPKSRRGALRLPGFGDEVAVDDALLARAGIARLFKGQEIEAGLVMEGSRVNLLSLSLPGRAAEPPANSLFGAGSVSAKSASRRQSRPVVIELKRDALRRVAARVEAEQLLGPHSGPKPAAQSSPESRPGRAGSKRRP